MSRLGALWRPESAATYPTPTYLNLRGRIARFGCPFRCRPRQGSAQHQTCDHDGMVEPDRAALEDLDDTQLTAALPEYLEAAMAGQSAEAEDAGDVG